MLSTLWRWRLVRDTATAIPFYPIELVCKSLRVDGDHALVILKTYPVPIVAISLGVGVDA